MDIEVIYFDENRNVEHKGDELIITPMSHGFCLTLKLPDGRHIYLSGPGQSPIEHDMTVNFRYTGPGYDKPKDPGQPPPPKRDPGPGRLANSGGPWFR